jgi:hypothetical protein
MFQKERKRLATRRSPATVKMFLDYKKLLSVRSKGMFNILQKIYNKNKEAAILGLEPPIHSNLMWLISSIPMLAVSYYKIRSNKGALTSAHVMEDSKYFALPAEVKSFINKTRSAPDGISKQILIETSLLLRQGRYPWGVSKRLYVDKPGKPGDKRPITVPPFMDRVVQNSISMVLQAIYEPWFELQNCSFGFRPRKGCHDAIAAIYNGKSRGMIIVLEGDIKGAFNNMNHDRMIDILKQRIKDNKFIQLMITRLKYTYYDVAQEKFFLEDKGPLHKKAAQNQF